MSAAATTKRLWRAQAGIQPLKLLLAGLLGIAVGCILVELGARLWRDRLPTNWQALPALYQGPPALNDLFLYDDRLRFKLRPDLHGLSFQPLGADSYFSISTISLGFPEIGFRTHPIANHPAAVAIGDSFTFCWTAQEDCWVDRLARLTGRDVINLGVPGYGGLQEARIVEDYALPLHPQLIIWTFFVNDLWDNARPNAVIGVDQWTWVERRSVVFGALRRLVDHRARSDDLGNGQLWVHDGGTRSKIFYDPSVISHWLSDEALERGWVLQRDALMQAKRLSDAAHVQLLMVLIPYREQIYFDEYRQFAPGLTLERMQQPYQMMREFCQQNGVDLLDTFDSFVAHRSQHFTYPVDAHLNALGNRIMAEAILRHLAQHQLLGLQ
jgi:GDSL-like lipase/acylhydrolase family protein